MRLLIPLTLLAASAAAMDNFLEFYISMSGECAGKCMGDVYEKATGCGDPSQSSSNACYCGLTQSQVDSMDTTSAIDSCAKECAGHIDTSKLSEDPDDLYNEVLNDQRQLCGSGSTTGSTTGGAASNARGGLAGVGLSVAVAYLFM